VQPECGSLTDRISNEGVVVVVVDDDDDDDDDSIRSSTGNDISCYENRAYHATLILEMEKIYNCAVKSNVSPKVNMIAYDLQFFKNM
jgi:hypothetical protein